MMYHASIRNSYGKTLVLTDNQMFDVVEIDGLDPPDVVLNMSHEIGADGSVFNSSYVDNRQIIITLAISKGCGSVRDTLYQFFQQKKQLTLMFSNDVRDVKMSCYVKSFRISIFAKKQTVQITLICPKPYFDNSYSLTYAVPMMDGTLSFPIEFSAEGMEFSNTAVIKDIINSGDCETGITATMRFFFETKNPVIRNMTTGDYFGIGLTLNVGDTISFCTVNKNKYANRITSGGTVSSVATKLIPGSSWIQMVPGENLLSLDSDDGVYFDATIEITAQYMGV